MRTQPTSAQVWPEEITVPNGVYVASGYGLRISIFHSMLRVDQGVGSDRTSVLLHRATSRLKRLVVIGHSGTISLEAIRFVADIKAGLAQCDADGRVLLVSGPLGSDRPALRRAQGKALGSARGLEIARHLVSEKIAAQRSNLKAVADRIPVAPE